MNYDVTNDGDGVKNTGRMMTVITSMAKQHYSPDKDTEGRDTESADSNALILNF